MIPAAGYSFVVSHTTDGSDRVVLLIRALPFQELVVNSRLNLDGARALRDELSNQITHLETQVHNPNKDWTPTYVPVEPPRITVKRAPFQPFYRFECSAHPEVGEGTFEDACFAADAGRRHLIEAHDKQESQP